MKKVLYAALLVLLMSPVMAQSGTGSDATSLSSGTAQESGVNTINSNTQSDNSTSGSTKDCGCNSGLSFSNIFDNDSYVDDDAYGD